MDLVEKIEVRNFRGLPDMATIRMADPEGKHVADPPFFIGDEIEIQLGDLDAASPTPVFNGEIVTFEPEFTSSAAMISVRAYDKSHRLQRNRAQRDLPGHDASPTSCKKVVGENGLAGRHDRGDLDRPPVPPAEHGVRPRLPQPARRDARTARSASPTGKVFLQKRRNGSGAGARRSSGARTSSRSSRA